MLTKQNTQDLLKRLKELKEENARLRAASAKEKATLIVTEGECKGFTTLTFKGSVWGFSPGVTKLRALKEAWPQVESFLRAIKRTSYMTKN